MPTFYDSQSNQPIEVPAEQVAQAWKAGAITAPAGAKISMLDPDNKPVDVPIEQFDQVINTPGYNFESAETKRKRVLEEEYGGIEGGIKAGAAGVGRGFSFGLSDWALRGLGVKEETLRNLKEAHPVTSAITEYGAIALSMLPSGGASLLGKGAGAAIKEAGLATRATSAMGKAVESTAAKALGIERITSAGGKALVHGAAAGLGAAAEGAVYGAGTLLSESALGETDLTAEHLMSSVGMGALLGGGLGVAIGGGGRLAMAGLGKAGTVAQDALGSLLNKAGEATGQTFGSKVRKAAAGGISLLSGKTAEEVERVLGVDTIKALAVPQSEITKNARNLAALHEEINTLQHDVLAASRGEAKRSAFREMVPVEQIPAARLEVVRVFDDMQGRLEEMSKAAPGNYDFPVARKRLADMVSVYKQKADEIMANIGHEGRATQGGELHGLVDNFKRDLYKENENIIPIVNGDRAATEAQLETAKALDKMYKDAAASLENKAVWGEKAGEVQQKMNQSYTAALDHSKRRSDHRFVEIYPGTNGELRVNSRPQGFEDYVGGLATSKSDLDEKWLLSQQKKMLDVGKNTVDLYQPGEGVAAKFRQWESKVKEFEALHGNTKKTITLKNQYESLMKDVAHTGQGVTMVGALAGGVPGAVVGGVIQMLANPLRVLPVIAQLSRIIEKAQANFAGKIDGAVAAMVSDSFKTITPIARSIAQRGITENTLSTKLSYHPEESHDTYKSLKQEIIQLANNQAYAAARLTEATKSITNGAPKLSQTLQMKANIGIQFLSSKMPKTYGDKQLMTAADVAKFHRYTRAVDNPMSVLDDLKNGRINPEGVEALRAVYPELYKQVVSGTLSKLSEGGKLEKLPMASKVKLSKLLGMPLTSAMRPANINLSQLLMRGAPQGQKQGTGKITNSMSKSLGKTADNELTESQRLHRKR
jgi:hypothetical protein